MPATNNKPNEPKETEDAAKAEAEAAEKAKVEAEAKAAESESVKAEDNQGGKGLRQAKNGTWTETPSKTS